MTFYEAAIQILKDANRPLHHKKITELALSQNLLSHVGKTPQDTMQTCLNEEVARGDRATISRVRPGVFALTNGKDVDSVRERLRITVPALTQPEPKSQPAQTRKTPSSEPVADQRRQPRSKAHPNRRRESEAPAKDTPSGDAAPPKTSKRQPEPKTASVERGLTTQFAAAEELDAAMAAVQDRSVGTAYQSLKQAHTQIRQATLVSLTRALKKLPPAKLVEFVKATLCDSGFVIQRVEEGEEISTLAVESTASLIPLKMAVRISFKRTAIAAEDVAALRGRLHHYGATHGMLVAVRDPAFETSAEVEAASNKSSPILLLDAEGVAPLALKAKVGVKSHSLEIPVLDGVWFKATK